MQGDSPVPAPQQGGARPGAGRPRKADKYAGPIAMAEDRIADHLPRLVDRMLDLASGIMVEDTNDLTGETKVYLRGPDRQAIEYLMNRLMGRPTDHVEQDTTHHGTVTVNLPERFELPPPPAPVVDEGDAR